MTTVLANGHPDGDGKRPIQSQRLDGKILALFVFIWILPAKAQSDLTFTFFGTISNVFFMPGTIYEGDRNFKFRVRGTNSSCEITNRDLIRHSHASFIGNNYYYYHVGPYTNKQGSVSFPVAARIDDKNFPRDDGSWINDLWLAFGCNNYFTNRVDLAAMPIWRTGLSIEDDVKMGTKALYSALSGAQFPNRIDYLSDGYDYFKGKSGDLVQKRKLTPPLDRGYTNFMGRALAFTNVGGVSLPVEFEICRFAPDRNSHAKGALRQLQYAHITVDNILINNEEISPPQISEPAVAIDYRFLNSKAQVKQIFLPINNGKWPSYEQAKMQFETQNQIVDKTAADEGKLGR